MVYLCISILCIIMVSICVSNLNYHIITINLLLISTVYGISCTYIVYMYFFNESYFVKYMCDSEYLNNHYKIFYMFFIPYC